ncbi:arylsulfatase B-like [Saccoglossus kowalevskii]|uniref:Arylsulfatase B-like n=1 Tax=Saccoglossus kowalevskii TaxID=10224 RepID=A0ABM0GN53_SACKO|nr:PREDICTED: arylsulfatase B-like [Saccoglossus kowalevskii]
MVGEIHSFLLVASCTLVSSSRPHIIFILADDLGWSDVGYHGSVIKTPHIDALASEGVKLDNYYTSLLCTPSRSQLMTGRYEIHTGLQHRTIDMMQPLCLPIDETILPQKLKDRGYATHMVGKWHLGFYRQECLPNNRGFDTFMGFYQAMGDYYYHNVSTGKFNGWDFRRDNDVIAERYAGQYSTHVFADEARDIISKHNPDVPLFLFLSFQAIHFPLQVPSRYADIYNTLIPNSADRRTYAGMVTCMDEAVGGVVATLKHSGLWENSVLVFSTDNGGIHSLGGNWPLRGGKASLYEGGVRGVAFVTSPLLPSRVRGTINKELLHMTDWFPTLVRLAGGHLMGNKRLDGYNQWDTISQETPSLRNEILLTINPLKRKPNHFVDDPYADTDSFDILMRAAIRVGDWKLITGPTGNGSWVTPAEFGFNSLHPEERTHSVELYNVIADPNERHDYSRDRPDIVGALLDRIGHYYKTSVPVLNPPQEVTRADPALHGGAWSPWR